MPSDDPTRGGLARRLAAETKAAFKTTEFYVLIARANGRDGSSSEDGSGSEDRPLAGRR